MRIAAIADLHIGSRARSDSFRHAPSRFARFLDRLEARFDRIVLVGDVFQAEHGWTVSRRVAHAELERGHRRVAELWRRFQGPRYVYLHGNHDQVAAELGARESLRLDADGFAVYFTHGHQFDPVLLSAYPLARASTWWSGRLRTIGLRGVAEWFEHHDVSIKYQRFRGPDGPYARAARRLLRTHAVDAVVLAHTHIPERLELAEGIMVNPGSCMRQLSYVAIDTAARSVEIVHEQS